MTLSERNTFFKIGVIFCSIITLLLIFVSLLIMPTYSAMEGNSLQPGSFFQSITGFFLKTDNLAVHISIILAVLFSLLSMLLIHSFFERTAAQEILFISFFTFSMSFEVFRLIVPLHIFINLPVFYLVSAARILLFSRLFSVFSVFAASICAAGLEVQRSRNIILFIIIPSLIISMGVTIDVQIWDTSFVFLHGFASMLKMIELLAVVIAVINFIVAVKKRNSREYFYVGAGVAIAMMGRYMLIGTDNWAGPVAGIILLVFGIWFVCSKIHKIHLWL